MITFRDVHKAFGEKKVLAGLNFSVHSEEIVFLLGTSGTGKSVTLKHIVGLLRPDSGNIQIDNEDITGYSEEDFALIRKKCGYVFQHPALFDSLSVFENVAFGLRAHGELQESQIQDKVTQSLELVGLRGINEKYPHELSYGEQKRVSIARTIAPGPSYLLFDEPTTGLDPITTNAVNTLIFKLSRKLGVTSIVVSHDMGCALKIADRIIVLEAGRLAVDGNVNEIWSCSQPLVKSFLEEVRLSGVDIKRFDEENPHS